MRLHELAAAQLPQAPEPLRIHPHPSLTSRLRRAISVPVAAAALVFLTIVVISLGSVWLQPHQPQQVAEQPASEPSDPTAPHTTTAKAPEAPESTSATLLVHVVGEVASPGVYELPEGARVLKAIEAAGGATEQAVLAAVNLARPLGDGEQLLIPNAEQAAAGLPGGSTRNTPAQTSSLGGQSPSGTQLVRLNEADAATFETLPHIGPALATRIVDWRTANGGFRSVDQLLEVSGIGQKTFDDIRELVTL